MCIKNNQNTKRKKLKKQTMENSDKKIIKYGCKIVIINITKKIDYKF